MKNYMKLKKKFTKALAVLTAISLLTQAIYLPQLYAMNGPSSPEFSNFQSVNSSGMVNEFSGGFSYNIPLLSVPGPNGSGYPINLSYQSGANPEEDASWVGFGWTLSPGAIVRNKQGYPDDVSAGNTTKYNKRNINWNVNLTSKSVLEAFSLDLDGEDGAASIVPTLSVSALINGYNGVSVVAGLEGSFSSGTGFNMDLGITTSGNHSFDVGFSPSEYYKSLGDDILRSANKTCTDYSSWRKPIADAVKYYDKAKNTRFGAQSLSQYASYLNSNHSFPSYVSSYQGYYASVNYDVEVAPAPIPVALGVKLGGSVGVTWAPETEEKTFYGYLHSAEATVGDNILMDYSTEKESTTSERDYYLGIPYSGADNFMVMGEGIGGTFRAYSKKAGHFRSNTANNSVISAGVGVDGMAGTAVGLGAEISGLGGQFVSTNEWYSNSNYRFSVGEDEAYYFQFMGDMGSSVDFGGDAAIAANLDGNDVTGYSPTIPSSVYEKANNSDERIKRSSYIGYHTIEETQQVDGKSKHFKRYNQREAIETLADRSSVSESQIAEFDIANASGENYVYGLPVYVKEEEQVSASIEPTTDFITYQNISNPDNKIGEYNPEKYAQSWLLTQITNPDFVDVDMNGPDEGDYGGWTIFNYEKYYGDGSSSNAWYNFRAPYTGLYNNPGRLSDSKDDMGSYNSGKKEMYYLESIETQTHLAVFTTSSSRTDGYEAWENNSEAANDASKKGSHGIKKLETITLYAKDDDNTDLSDNPVIETIHFEYDNSLMLGQANSDDGTTAHAKTGKTTLKRVWIEYADVKNAKISPYDFVYEYPSGSDYPAPYNTNGSDDCYSFYSSYSSTDQNPNYDALNSDRWGSYQADGAARYSRTIPWVDQTPETDLAGNSITFDPAAWQLKQIKLPTGGEIHVQYEQNEYSYVQDKRAMVMASISSIDAPTRIEGQEDNTYYLNTEEAGIDLSVEQERTDYINYLNKKFVTGENGQDPEKIYFKFFYSLTTGEVGDCGMEWIDGYVSVREVGYDNTAQKLYLKLGEDATNGNEKYDVPREVCKDFYNQTRAGKIDFTTTNCEVADITAPSEGTSDVESFFESVVAFFDVAAAAIGAEVCLAIDESNSYFRIPIQTKNAKKGGGIRVKRVLLYDKGLENNPSLNGQEYIYLNTDSTSSGVATNEPQTGGEENALVCFMEKRSDPSLLTRIMSGKDREEFEGPIGANMLPSPSVGYSRVIIRDINNGPSRPALVEKDFYTSKDYPLQVENTTLTKKILPIPALTYPISMSIYNIWAAQGYSFILNNMNGQVKAEKTLLPSDPTAINTNLQVLTSKEYIYYGLGEQVKTVDAWDWQNGGSFTSELSTPGKQSEVVMESSQVWDVSVDAKFEGDANFGILGIAIIPFPMIMPYVNYSQNMLSTHVINKITYYPAILKTVKSTQDGIEVSSTNECFDKYTGTPVVTSTKDVYNNLTLMNVSHDGTYYSYNFPASHFYDALKGKSQNEACYIESSTAFSMAKLAISSSGGTVADQFYLSLTGSGICDNIDKFTSGSLIAIYNNIDKTAPDIYNIGEITGGLIELLPTNDTYGFYYNNSTDSPENVNVEILRSGNTNQLSARVGSLTTYGGMATATVQEVPTDVIEARQSVVDVLNSQYKGSVNVITSAELASMSDAGIVNPENGECEPFTTVFDDYANSLGLSSVIQGSGSASNNGNGIIFSNSSEKFYGTKVVCELVPMHITNCHNEDNIYDQNIVICDTIPAHRNCETQQSTYNKDFLNISVGNASEATDGIDNDEDGKTDESDEGTDNCEMLLSYIDGYEFFLDAETAELMYGDKNNTCDAVQIKCLDFCPNYFPTVTLDKVVSASAIELSDDWNYSSVIKSVYTVSSSSNAYETGEKGKWRLLSSYTYNTDVKNISDADAYAYNTGIFNDFTLYNWQYHDANNGTKWVNTNTVDYYSPLGAPLEEKNLLDIHTTAKYGYDHSVPYLTAGNASYESVAFESFENGNLGTYALMLEDKYSINTDINGNQYFGEWSSSEAHSGSHSYKMKLVKDLAFLQVYYSSEVALPSFYPSESVYDYGMDVKLWMKRANMTDELDDIQLILNNTYNAAKTYSVKFEKVARVGEWELYEAKSGTFIRPDWPSSYAITPTLYVKTQTSGAEIYIDDVRVQPINSQSTAYVYDASTLRLLAQFDDQNFGLFYQYNDEGKLIRKQIETERGVKSVAETQYNIPKVDK